MLGPPKERSLDRPILVSLEALVPADHFYRHLEAKLDLGFVRDLVAATYAPGGRPSIDPVVFFKLQLVMFFEGIRSERQLLRVVADRLSVRWYLGYDLGEELPDHSSLTRMRERYGVETFRRFFEGIVEQCQAAGLVWGKEIYVDATKVQANASLDSLEPRFAVEAHLQRVFAPDAGEGSKVETAEPPLLPVPLSDAAQDTLAARNQGRHDWLARDGEPDRTVIRGGYRRLSDLRASPTDPDAGLMPTRDGLHPGYLDHYVVDGGKARIILNALVTPADVTENLPLQDLVWRTCFRWRLRPRHVTGDTKYATLVNIAALERGGIRAYVPLPDFDHRSEFFGKGAFAYDAARDVYTCPRGATLPFHHIKNRIRARVYQADPATCNACPLKARCTPGSRGREVNRYFEEAYLDRVRAYHATAPCQKAIRKRDVWVEPLFAEAKDWHGLRRFRLRRLRKVNAEALLTATGQNLKRLVSKRGWGRRPFPNGAAGIVLPPFARRDVRSR
jgi:transposase